MVNSHAQELGGCLEIGLYDTMIDLGLEVIGAVMFVPLGVHYIKHRGKSKIAPCIIPVFTENAVADGPWLGKGEKTVAAMPQPSFFSKLHYNSIIRMQLKKYAAELVCGIFLTID